MDTLGNVSPIGQHDKLTIAENFSEGFICINFKKSPLAADKWGCLNEKGDTVIHGKYLEPFYFANGVAKVSILPLTIEKNNDEEVGEIPSDYFCRYINKLGNDIIDTTFEGALSTDMQNSWAIAKAGNYWYLLSKNGLLMELSVDFEMVYPLRDGVAKCKRMNGYTNYIDTTRWPVLELSNEYYTGSFSNGFADYSTIKGKYGFINKKGKPITPCIYDAVSNFSENIAAVKMYNTWGFIDDKGRLIINPKYESTLPFQDGLAGVKLNNKIGFIGENGDLVIQFQFTNITAWCNGIAAAASDKNLWGYINKKGKWIIEPQFLNAQNFDKNGFAVVEYADKHSYVKGKLKSYEKALISKNKKVVWKSGELFKVK